MLRHGADASVTRNPRKMADDKLASSVLLDTLLGSDWLPAALWPGALRPQARQSRSITPPKCWPTWPMARVWSEREPIMVLYEFKTRAVHALHDANLQRR